jgi:hypothetical protein
MKNTQKGFIVPVLIIVVVLAIGGGAYLYSQDKQNDSTDQNTSNESTSDKLTENDIYNATYTLSANFGGEKTVPQNVVFPENHVVYITEEGKVLTERPVPLGEVFGLNAYRFTNSAQTEAVVYIGGNFGSSGFDDRAFIVTKVNGKVTTQETTCEKTSNGMCEIPADSIR